MELYNTDQESQPKQWDSIQFYREVCSKSWVTVTKWSREWPIIIIIIIILKLNKSFDLLTDLHMDIFSNITCFIDICKDFVKLQLQWRCFIFLPRCFFSRVSKTQQSAFLQIRILINMFCQKQETLEKYPYY